MNHTLKVIGMICIFLLLILGISLTGKYSLEKSSKVLESHIEKIESNILQEKWDAAKGELETVQEKWSKTEKLWGILLDHFEIDNIDTTLSKMSKYIEVENTPLSLAESAALRQYIRHIPEKEKFNMENIF